MPIKAENRVRYAADWSEISARVRQEAEQKCEWCGVPNGAWGYRDDSGKFHECPRDGFGKDYGRPPFWFGHRKIIAIVLTVAHIDHQPENNDRDNLRALCQRCHLRHDAKHHAANAAATRRAKLATPDLFATGGGDE